MSDPYTAIQIVMMPRDTNPHGTIFGGVILTYIDMAGATAARREVALRGGPPDAKIVTVAVNRVEFQAARPGRRRGPVRDQRRQVGRTSITMRIQRRWPSGPGQNIHVTESEVVYVGVGRDRQPVPLLLARPAAPADPGPAGCIENTCRSVRPSVKLRWFPPACSFPHQSPETRPLCRFRPHSLYFDDVEVGQEWESSGRTVTEADIVNFAGVSGDFNPIHMDHEFAKTTPFRRPIAHGLLGVRDGQRARGLPARPMRTIAFLQVREWNFGSRSSSATPSSSGAGCSRRASRGRGRRGEIVWYRGVVIRKARSFRTASWSRSSKAGPAGGRPRPRPWPPRRPTAWPGRFRDRFPGPPRSPDRGGLRLRAAFPGRRLFPPERLTPPAASRIGQFPAIHSGRAWRPC